MCGSELPRFMARIRVQFESQKLRCRDAFIMNRALRKPPTMKEHTVFSKECLHDALSAV
jgi:hypothetical protein